MRGFSCFSFSSERGRQAVSALSECAFGRRSLIPIIRLLDLDHLSLLTPITHIPPIIIPYSMPYPNLINGSTYAQQKLAEGQLDESRNLALNNQGLIQPM